MVGGERPLLPEVLLKIDTLTQRLGLSCTSILVYLHSFQVNFSNNPIGFLLNGVYGLNLPP